MIHIALGVLIIFLLILFFNKWYKKTNHYRNQFIDTYKFINLKNEIKLDLINLGSNHPKFAFDYMNIGIKGMNCGLGPQTLEYDFNILKSYHSILKKEGCVIIPLCLFSFFKYRDKNIFENNKYYFFLNKSLIFNYSSRQYKQEIKYPLLFHLKRLRYIIKDVPIDKRLDFNENPMNQQQIEQDAAFWVRVWEQEFNIKMMDLNLNEKNKESIQKNIQILCGMLHFCIERNYKPIIMLLPLTKELGNKFTDSFVYKYILSYINTANDVQAPILNYMRDPRFVDSSLYINSFFFNKTGRKLFTETVVNDLKTQKIL